MRRNTLQSYKKFFKYARGSLRFRQKRERKVKDSLKSRKRDRGKKKKNKRPNIIIWLIIHLADLFCYFIHCDALGACDMLLIRIVLPRTEDEHPAISDGIEQGG